MLKKILIAILAPCLWLIVSAAVPAPRKPSPDVKAKVTFVYCDPAGPDYSACVANNKVRNDSGYEYIDGVDNVSAVFNLGSGGSRDLTVNLNSSPRTSILDLSDIVPGSEGQSLPAWRATPQNTQWHFN